MARSSRISGVLFLSLISLVQGQVSLNGNVLDHKLVAADDRINVWGGEVIGPIPETMSNLTMHSTASGDIFPSGSELKLKCRTGKRFMGCEFFISFHHCNPKSCSSLINGGFPAILGADGWVGAPCAPKFTVSGVQGYPMTTLRKEVLSGSEDTITTSENLKYFVVFQRFRILDCASLDESLCDSSSECLWRFGRCQSNYCPRPTLPGPPGSACKCALASAPECKRTRSPKGYKGVCKPGVSCTSIVCAKNYAGTPVVTCKAGGQAFMFKGCKKAKGKNCKRTRSPKGYVGVCPTGPTCEKAISCAKKYKGKPIVKCVQKGKQFIFTGCQSDEGNGCKRTKSPKGYVGVCLKGEECNSIVCQKKYRGSPVVKCPGKGKKFVFSGCTIKGSAGKECVRTKSPKGYIGVCRPGAKCTSKIRCQKNYSGSPVVTCPGKGKKFVFTGCTKKGSAGNGSSRKRCVRTKSPKGYIGVCRPGAKCTSKIRCQKNYSGSPVVKCPGKGKKFVFSGCRKKGSAERGCVRTKSPKGYIGVCRTGAKCTSKIRCQKNYSGSPVVTCPAKGKQFVFTGCRKKGSAGNGSSGKGCIRTKSPKGYIGVCRPGAKCTSKIRCQKNYGGSPVVKCPGNGKKFVFTGCTKKGSAGKGSSGKGSAGKGSSGKGSSGKGCIRTKSPKGYIGVCRPGAKCTSKIRCQKNYGGSPVVKCPGNGKKFVFTGCTKKVSTAKGCLLTKSPKGFVGACPAGPKCTAPIRCEKFYHGKPLIKCPGTGKPFLFSGCSRDSTSSNGCSRTKSPKGYIGICPAGSSCAGKVRCHRRFKGKPIVTCTGKGEPFSFTGCTQ